ncbi:hypothetical protein NDU88_000987 [Pleurodeles waltl]|uniref:Uncharacterized protein n=1 Tax=Pleurodeles waltl TaxID=8319 RepID=A0AAV7UST3_PLEWA|nr:hypothetical protein NDU88_000987 [Pleurodeles waltl]
MGRFCVPWYKVDGVMVKRKVAQQKYVQSSQETHRRKFDWKEIRKELASPSPRRRQQELDRLPWHAVAKETLVKRKHAPLQRLRSRPGR